MPPPPSGHVVLSLFDRLTDYEPRSRTELPAGSWDRFQELKQSVARDLTNLLNTRRSETDIPEEFVETNRSIAAYGMQDISASPVDRNQIRRAVEKSIRTFEPRLTHVSVEVEETGDLRLDYRIIAVLHMDFRAEPVVFDAVLPKFARRFQVSEGR